ncbi:hypothetical protein H1Z99_004896 [Salmonella enterica subsp. enterica serovar Meleagridis]|nr:hypothetical protein [Salmonella enterica subsp. enterica serovar Cerro]EGD4263621.1 hypothetical protein [Salmonella enterica subsp. enterica serovar Cerro]EGD4267972.1 hypothetical protein [Salmonella enterica subsp. enterica serovar Cerro]EGD4276616.1 hypothetical protein [Salmonella enterica subsp. enterica serovar Meleagridis]EGD4286619.1 hypothetical protein [Salmonella enterica subsp. enterica serovar Meleagridis]
MKKDADLKPRNLSAAVRLRLDEIENWLDRGITRQEIAEILGSEYSFSVTAKGLEMALYRARQNRKHVLHNTVRGRSGNAESVLHNTQGGSSEERVSDGVLHNTEKPSEAHESDEVESPGIIDKEFFNKIGEDFDPKKFNKKF